MAMSYSDRAKIVLGAESRQYRIVSSTRKSRLMFSLRNVQILKIRGILGALLIREDHFYFESRDFPSKGNGTASDLPETHYVKDRAE